MCARQYIKRFRVMMSSNSSSYWSMEAHQLSDDSDVQIRSGGQAEGDAALVDAPLLRAE